MSKVLITGGSGLVGSALSQKLKKKGYEVIWLSTQKNKSLSFPTYYWNISNGYIDTAALQDVDYIIHLAGVNVGEKCWTKKQKKAILSSRVDGAQLLWKKIQEHAIKLKAFISASGISYYGTRTSEVIYKETDSSANDFLANVTVCWEEAADKFLELGVRVVKFRMGVVIAPHGGVLNRVLIPTKLGVASALGTGKQYMPWIQIDDLTNIYIKAIEDNFMQGAYNAVAPEHITNKMFMKHLARVLNKPFFMPAIPSMVLKLIFGEMADIILEGSRGSSQKITDAGYCFVFPTIDSAFRACILHS